MVAHHYLSFQCLLGKGVRHVATLEETWIALLGQVIILISQVLYLMMSL